MTWILTIQHVKNTVNVEGLDSQTLYAPLLREQLNLSAKQIRWGFRFFTSSNPLFTNFVFFYRYEESSSEEDSAQEDSMRTSWPLTNRLWGNRKECEWTWRLCTMVPFVDDPAKAMAQTNSEHEAKLTTIVETQTGNWYTAYFVVAGTLPGQFIERLLPNSYK